MKEDQAPSAILELVDGPKDMRFAMTARTVAKLESEGKELNEMTQRNVDKVTQFRRDGKDALRDMVGRLKDLHIGDRTKVLKKEWVYPIHEKEKNEMEKLKKKKPSTYLV